MGEITLPPSRLFDVPCLYGEEFGPDLMVISEILHLPSEEIIRIHSGKEYFIYDTGFIGGSTHFKIPPPLDSLPRKKTPNLRGPDRGGAGGRRHGKRLQTAGWTDRLVLDRNLTAAAVVSGERPAAVDQPGGSDNLQIG